jgi:hypothetical protein
MRRPCCGGTSQGAQRAAPRSEAQRTELHAAHTRNGSTAARSRREWQPGAGPPLRHAAHTPLCTSHRPHRCRQRRRASCRTPSHSQSNTRSAVMSRHAGPYLRLSHESPSISYEDGPSLGLRAASVRDAPAALALRRGNSVHVGKRYSSSHSRLSTLTHSPCAPLRALGRGGGMLACGRQRGHAPNAGALPKRDRYGTLIPTLRGLQLHTGSGTLGGAANLPTRRRNPKDTHDTLSNLAASPTRQLRPDGGFQTARGGRMDGRATPRTVAKETNNPLAVRNARGECKLAK